MFIEEAAQSEAPVKHSKTTSTIFAITDIKCRADQLIYSSTVCNVKLTTKGVQVFPGCMYYCLQGCC